MSNLLLNLRHVPDDEADEVRALLDARRIDYYETPPSRWGVSAGAIWIREDGDAALARQLLADYQAERRTRAQAEYAAARRDGTAPTWWTTLRDEPMRLLLVAIAVALALGLVLLPVWLMSR